MSRSLTLRNRQERDALAARLRELADKLDRLADAHCETLDYEGYSGLCEHAAELKAIIRVLQADDLVAVLHAIIADANDHVASVEEAYGSGGDA